MPQYECAADFTGDGTINILDLVIITKLATSKSEIRRMIKNSGLKINNETVSDGKKIIFQEAPEVLPPDILKKIKTGIAKRILSENKEKWWTIPTAMVEIDNLRDKYSNENNEDKLKFLDEFDKYIMSIQKKYENI